MAIILAVETSCDDTCVCIFDTKVNKSLSNLVASQDHNKFGGIFPEYAARNHSKTLPIIIKHALKEAIVELNDVDLIAVTRAPGLIGSLMVGTSYAKALAWSLNKPIIGIHHIEAHILIAHYDCNLEFPYGALVASGGHTLLAMVEGLGKYKLLGVSLDDAAGECFDKVAREMGLPQPGGPNIERLALNGKVNIPMTLPLHKDGSCNFSFSGLKTSAIRIVQSNQFSKEDIAASFQDTVAKTFAERMQNAINDYPDVRNWVLVGGVAANKYIRQTLSNELPNINICAPSLKLCTDNAMMIAYTAKLYSEAGHLSDLSLEPVGSMSLEKIVF